MAISLDKLIDFHHKALNIRERKMEIISSNLVNSDTPHYKAKDIDFRAHLEKATSGLNQSNNKMTSTNSKHFELTSSVASEVQYRIPLQPDTGDGNTVEVQQERNRFLENGLRFQVSLRLLDGKFKGMKKAINGGQA